MIIDPGSSPELADSDSVNGSSVSSYSNGLSPNGLVTPSLPPPKYSYQPTQPITYAFTGWLSDAMLLMPTCSGGSQSPLYHISVNLNLNPFSPLSYITTVRRGGSRQGPFVGSFEISINQQRGILTLGDSTTRLKNIMWNIQGSSRHWGWSCGNVNLRWDCRSALQDGSPMCICYDGKSSSDHQLASFIPPPVDASPPIPAAVLTIYPDGYELFDSILLSALIVDRKRNISN